MHVLHNDVERKLCLILQIRNVTLRKIKSDTILGMASHPSSIRFANPHELANKNFFPIHDRKLCTTEENQSENKWAFQRKNFTSMKVQFSSFDTVWNLKRF